MRETIFDERGAARREAARGLGAIAREIDTSAARLAIAWVLNDKRASCAITGASSCAHLEENVGAIELLPLDPAVCLAIESLIEGI